MTKTLLILLGSILIVLASAAASCSASKPDSTIIPSTPTPLPLSRANPNIIEEDSLHIVERYPKNEYIRIDERHIRSPIIPLPLTFFKEDENYYYVYTYKRSAEMEEIAKGLRALTPSPASPPPGTTATPPGPPLSDLEDLSPAREPARVRLEAGSSSGLPSSGLWRASFVMADMNGDGIPDIVAPPSRLGDAKLHIWIGDGKGRFSPWPLKFVEDGNPNPSFSLDYGAVAVGDIDGDGRLDIVCASHGFGLVSLFGEGGGTFRVVRKGLPTKDFSSQAIVLSDADGDGKLDIIASADKGVGDDPHQVRVYFYRGSNGWHYEPDAIVALYSNSLHAWDFDGDGRRDILTGSHFVGPKTLLWKNMGNGKFEPVTIPEIEIFAYHFATAPGTFGRERVPAFADAYYMFSEDAKVRATGVSIYSFEMGNWARHRVWRKKSGLSAQYALAVGDLDGDGLDDIVFPDSEVNKLRIFFQRPDGTFAETADAKEPSLDSPVQCVRLADLDGDGRLDIVLSKTVSSSRPNDRGGWNVYLNRR